MPTFSSCRARYSETVDVVDGEPEQCGKHYVSSPSDGGAPLIERRRAHLNRALDALDDAGGRWRTVETYRSLARPTRSFPRAATSAIHI